MRDQRLARYRNGPEDTPSGACSYVLSTHAGHTWTTNGFHWSPLDSKWISLVTLGQQIDFIGRVSKAGFTSY